MEKIVEWGVAKSSNGIQLERESFKALLNLIEIRTSSVNGNKSHFKFKNAMVDPPLRLPSDTNRMP
ncbi:hypothetical protein G9A89_005300 [Geosiphon pyriformis]|nr:hypothetical protein G9A89_005300 [Geosiphon pyriformis]